MIKTYPSGFVGLACVPQTPPISESQLTRTSVWVGAVTKVNPNPGMLDVQVLWDAVRSGDPSVNTFEFREQILKAAKPAFGYMQYISGWIADQAAAPATGEYHRRWVEETVAYVIDGKPRRYTWNMWYGLFDSAPPNKRRIEPILGQYFGSTGPYREMTTVQFLAQWVTRERGILDLLESLALLYGKR